MSFPRLEHRVASLLPAHLPRLHHLHLVTTKMSHILFIITSIYKQVNPNYSKSRKMHDLYKSSMLHNSSIKLSNLSCGGSIKFLTRSEPSINRSTSYRVQ